MNEISANSLSDEISSQDGKHSTYVTRAAVLALCLAVVKVALFLLTGSMVVALSALDSLIDAGVSLINRKVIRFSNQEADSNHPYGHGKAESIAALGQSVMILLGSFIIIGTSAMQLFKKSYLTEGFGGYDFYLVFFFLFAAIASIAIASLLKNKGERYQSPALIADGEHYKVDFISNLGNAVTFALIAWTSMLWLDPVVAALTGLWMIRGGWSLLIASIDDLMDHDISEEDKNKAISLIHQASPKVIDVHKLRGRRSGSKALLDFHVTLPSELSFHEVHDIVEEIEETLAKEMAADAVVHADPDDI